MGLDKSVAKYHCIECGEGAHQLYLDYNAGVIKIAHCESCQGIVDKYIEFDPVVIFLDAFLLKRTAFRHVLYNANLQCHWKLTLVFLLCDAYTKLFRLRGPVSDKLKPDYVFYSALEWDLYVMFFIACAEMAVCFISIYTMIFTIQTLKKIERTELRDILLGILLSNFGKLLVVPAILWGQSDSLLYVWLTKTFVLTANVQAIRVVCNFGPLLSAGLVGFGHVSQIFVADWLHKYSLSSGIG